MTDNGNTSRNTYTKIRLTDRLTRRGAMEEIGIGGPIRTGGRIEEEFLPQLQGKQGAQTYSEMRRNDPIIGAILFAVETVLRSVDWSPQPGGDTEADEKATAFLESNLIDMSHTWNDFTDDILSIVVHGWAWFNTVYKLRRGENAKPHSQFDDGLLGWRKFSIRAQEGLDEWQFDEHGGVEGMWHAAPPANQRVFIPIQNSILFRTRHERGSPEGYSLLRNAYRPWYAKKTIEWLEGVGVERDLVGLGIITPAMDTDWQSGSTARTEALAILERLRVDEQGGIMLPPPQGPDDHQKWHFELIGSPGSKLFDTNAIINRYANEIAVSVLAGVIRFGLSGVGTYNLAENMLDLFQLALNGILNGIKDTLNRFAVAPLFTLNGSAFAGITARPTLMHSGVTKRDVVKVAASLSTLVKNGIITPDDELEAHMRTNFGLPDRVPETSREMPKPDQSQPKDSGGSTAPEKESAIEPYSPSQLPDMTDDDWPTHASTSEEDEDTDWYDDNPDPEPQGWRRIFGRGPRKTPLSRVRTQARAGSAAMDTLAAQFKAGTITRGQFITGFQVQVRDSMNTALSMAQRRLTPATRAIPRATRNLATQYANRQLGYARGLMSEMDGLSQAKLAQRAKLYTNSSEGLYHTVVRDGAKPEMQATWRLGEAEHCPDCLSREDKSWRADELPWVPRDGQSQCLGNCRCWVQYTKSKPGDAVVA